LARRLSEGARKRGKDYDWEVLAERVLRVYLGVTAGRSVPVDFDSKEEKTV
jgi:glycosyltransferase involved in cell wall biosynthesis